jgi:uncharacterized protein (DUF433 family)
VLKCNQFERVGERDEAILLTAADTKTHIEIDSTGRAWLAGANTKVVEVVLDKLAYGWSPEEMHLQHPHLSLAQIHSALAYYYDHQAEIDLEIADQIAEYAKLRAAAEDSLLRTKLRSLGKLR